MESRVSVTYQIDDLEAAALELLTGVQKDAPLRKNSVGLLFCYSDMDISGMAKVIGEKAGFDIIGCTSIASMDRAEGFHEMAMVLTVLTADDCTFGVAISEPINPGNVAAQVESAYQKAAGVLEGDPKLLFAIPPYILEIMLDEYTMALNKVAGGVPAVGGLPSNNSNGDHNMTIFNGEAYSDRLVFLAVGGAVKPVFSVCNVVAGSVQRKRKVTEARDNVVYRVGEQTFVEYLEEVGLPVEKLVDANNTITFVSNPLLLENTSTDGDGQFSFARTLHEIDLEKGSGTAIGRIPQGATISICSLRREEIEVSAAAGVRNLAEQMKAENGYAYSTVLAISCIGRHLLMLPQGSAETAQILASLPEGVTLAGFYGYGEIGPQGMGRTANFAHNESLVLCAF